MTLSEIKRILEAEILYGEDMLDIEVNSGFACDLISDSLCFSRPGCLLLTGLTNIQIIKVAEMVKARAIVFVRGKNPGPEIVQASRKRELPVMVTNRFLFESCGLLFQAGLRSS